MAVNGHIPPDTEGAFVEWINSFPLTRQVTSLKALNDGQVIWEMLRYIDEHSFSSELPNTKQSHYARRQNLQFILDSVQARLTEEGKTYDRLTEDDLDQMASGESPLYVAGASPRVSSSLVAQADGSRQFIRMILLVMLSSPKIAELVETIQTLPGSTQQAVGNLMQEIAPSTPPNEPETSMDPADEESDGRAPTSSAGPDLRAEVLQLEEQYAKVQSQLERLNRQYKELDREHQAACETLERTQETNDALTSQVVERDEQLKKLSSISNQREQLSVRELEIKISQQEEVISNHETDLAKAHAALQETRREAKKLNESNDKLQKLQDNYDAMKLDLEKQTRKANTVDKYMQKLQASQALERERDALRQELDELQAQLASAANFRVEKMKLQKTNEEVSRTLAQIEREHGELHLTTKQLRYNCGALSQQVDDLNERFAQDQETIAELREGRGENQAPGSPMGNGQLDGELFGSSQRDSNLKSRVLNLEKELADRNTAVADLQSRLDDAKATSDKHFTQLQSSRQETVALQNSLSQVQHGHPIEGFVDFLQTISSCADKDQSTEVFKRMRDQCKNGEAQRLELEQTVASLREENEWMRANGSSTHLDKDGAVEQLRKQCAEKMTQMQTKFDAEQKQKEHLRAELDSQAKQTQSDQKKTLLDGLSEDELTRLLEQSRGQTSKQRERKGSPPTSRDLADQVEDKDQSSRPKDLDDLKPQARFYIQNLEREIKLMASAYHDLTSRLQMNNVTLQRRADNPKNWLGRQRRALEGPTGITR